MECFLWPTDCGLTIPILQLPFVGTRNSSPLEKWFECENFGKKAQFWIKIEIKKNADTISILGQN